MLSLYKINKKIEEQGIPLELMGSKGSYCLTTPLGEGTVYFSDFEFMKTKNYPSLEGNLKLWVKRAVGLHSQIRKRITLESKGVSYGR